MLTVTTAATKFDLITLASVRTALNSDRGDDPFLKAAITQASDVIARHCKRIFAQETVVETLRLDQSKNDLVLARYPVSAITSVVEGNTTVDPTMYELNGDSGVLRRLAGDGTSDGWWGATRIVVSYTSGFVLPAACPPALAKACMRLVQQFFEAADRDPMIRSETADQIDTATFFSGGGVLHLSPEIIGMLVPFRNYRQR